MSEAHSSKPGGDRDAYRPNGVGLGLTIPWGRGRLAGVIIGDPARDAFAAVLAAIAAAALASARERAG